MAGNLNKVMEQINRAIGQLVKRNERQIARRYARAIVEIRAALAKLYEKYERDGVLTWADMAKYDRLKRFLDEINRVVLLVHKDLSKQIFAALGEVYQEGYYLTAWAVETETKTRLAYSTVTADTIVAAINNPISGLTLKERLEKNRREIILTIQQEVTQGLVKGETYKTMAGRLKVALEGDAAKATRIVRTEAHRVQENAKHDAMVHADNNGVRMMKEWNSLEDERVRNKLLANHRKLNGKRIPVSGIFRQGRGAGPGPGMMGRPEHDINCRCFLTYTVAKVERKQYNEIESTTFDNWRQNRLKVSK